PGQTRGHPGTRGPPPGLREELALTQRGAHPRLGDRDLSLHDPLGDLPGHLAADRPDLALELPHAGLTRVVGDDYLERRVAECNPAGREPVALDLARHQVALGDLELLLLGIAGELDHLHPVP